VPIPRLLVVADESIGIIIESVLLVLEDSSILVVSDDEGASSFFFPHAVKVSTPARIANTNNFFILAFDYISAVNKRLLSKTKKDT